MDNTQNFARLARVPVPVPVPVPSLSYLATCVPDRDNPLLVILPSTGPSNTTRFWWAMVDGGWMVVRHADTAWFVAGVDTHTRAHAQRAEG